MYYCEIPWDQIWKDFNEWYHEAPGDVDWDGQRKAFQKIAKEVIPYRIRWKQKVWAPFNEWYDKTEPGWNAQRKTIQELVQTEADYSVNQ